MSKFLDKGTNQAYDFQNLMASLPGSQGGYLPAIHYGLSVPSAGWEMGFGPSLSGPSQWPIGYNDLCFEGPLSNPFFSNDAAAGLGGVKPYQSYQLDGSDPAFPYQGVQMIKQETSPDYIGGIVAQNTLLAETVTSTPVGVEFLVYTTPDDGISHKYRISSFLNNTFDDLTANMQMLINFTDVYGNTPSKAMSGTDYLGSVQTQFGGTAPNFVPMNDCVIMAAPNTQIIMNYQVMSGNPVSDLFASIYMLPKDS